MGFWQDFREPPVRNRIKPFWFWNGAMEEEEVRLQIREMAEKGLGGAFLCARQGLKIPYLSEEWFWRVKEACGYARENGLENWLYDEYPYPSGMSGGEVLLQHPESAHTCLRVDRWDVTVEGTGAENGSGSGKPVQKDLGWSVILYARAVRKGADGIPQWEDTVDLTDAVGSLQTQELYQQTGLTAYNRKRFFSYGPRHILTAELPEGEWTIFVLSQEPIREFKYYGGYFDPCSEDAVRTFLDTTHERYRRYLGEEFGRSVHGMFSDEVGLLGRLPWTARIWERFRERNGYDLREALPALADRSFPDAARIRFDFFQTVHELFVDSYHRQVAGWCGEHSLLYATEVPSMRMSTQRYSTVIGGDTCHEKLGRPLAWILSQTLGNYRANAKSVSALARQLDRPYAMIESFHSVGWSMTLQDAKWMVDLLGVCGINLFNFHAFYFTTDGITKHDAPPSQFLQNPYWRHYRLLADYVARMSVFNTYTDSTVSVAVLDPAVSLFTCLGNPFHGFAYGGEDPREKAACDGLRASWVALCAKLLLTQMEYDNLDTEILCGARIEGGHILLGRADYTTVIIPPATCLEADAVRILTEFMDQGGAVLLMGELPDLVVGGEADLAAFRANPGLHALPLPEAPEAGPLSGEDAVCAVWEDMRKLLDARDRRFARLEVPEENRKDFLFTCRRSRDGGRFALAANQGGSRVKARLTLRPEGDGENPSRGEVRGDCAGADYSEDHCGEAPSREEVRGDCAEAVYNKDHCGRASGSGRNSRVPRVYRLCLEDGGRRRLEVRGGCVELVFAPYESYCLELVDPASDEEEPCLRERPEDDCMAEEERNGRAIVICTDEPMKVSIEGGNILRLESFDMSLDGREWQRTDPKTFIEQQARLQQLSGRQLRFHGDFGTPKRLSVDYPLTAVYRAAVMVEALSGPVSLLMDGGAIGGEFTLYVNGRAYTADDFEPVRVTDYRNRSCDITDSLRPGENVLLVETAVTDDSCGLRDPLYLWGAFGVKQAGGVPVLTEMPERAQYRETFVEGFPFYSGTFTFEKTFPADAEQAGAARSLVFDFGDGRYDCMEVSVNGTVLGVRAFTPYRFTVPAGVLREGENLLTLKVTNTLANMLDGVYFDYREHRLVPVLREGQNR